MDKAALQDAVNTLTAILDEFKENTKIAKVLKSRVLNKGYETITQIKKEHDLA
jgi:hypothetical protein